MPSDQETKIDKEIPGKNADQGSLMELQNTRLDSFLQPLGSDQTFGRSPQTERDARQHAHKPHPR